MKLLLVFSVLLLASSLEAERCTPMKCPANEVWSCCPPCPQRYLVRIGMNWVIVLLFAAGCGICVAQTTTTSPRPGTTRTSKPEPKGLIPLTAGAKCPIRTCRRNEVLRTCGLCYDNTCSGQAIPMCQKICYCGCYCKVGYVRTTTDGPCVLPKQCPIVPIEDSG
ncbi:uncharacterized protein LOC128298910 [Anopheles moucheti]|uniref:uncharacterized protein LOC128298910 n=1 Tax=Anopheles moucheti TaxID=186751 RepID=UPI0022F13D37|nr:uncharacterized protein LOC128298910 [Anopheles moucheti]